MPGGPGRDQRAPMERLTRVLYVLSTAGARGAAAERLLRVADYGAAAAADRRDQLRRDLRHLSSLGWEITRVSGEGETARYRLTAVDNRLRLDFPPEERYELLRAARVAGVGELADDLAGSHASDRVPDREPVEAVRGEVGPLDVVQRAVHRHCLLRFGYKGRARVVHPYGLYSRTAGWYLTGREDGGDAVKTFALSRMSEASVDRPGTADRPATPARPRLDPVSWLVDEPVEALVATTPDHAARVIDLLGSPTGTDEVAGERRLTIPVTNRAAFRARLYELGTRARLLGPPELREELRAALLAVATGRSA